MRQNYTITAKLSNKMQGKAQKRCSRRQIGEFGLSEGVSESFFNFLLVMSIKSTTFAPLFVISGKIREWLAYITK